MNSKHIIIVLLLVCVAAFVGFFVAGILQERDGNDVPIAANSTHYSDMSNLSETIAIIDLKKVAMESEAGKSIENQVIAINEASKKDLIDLESKIKSMEKNKLSENDTRKVDDMQLMLYDMVNTKRNQISEAYKKAISELEIAMNNAISYISERQNIKIVFTSDAVVSPTKTCHDITQDVIARINETCTKIPVLVKW